MQMVARLQCEYFHRFACSLNATTTAGGLEPPVCRSGVVWAAASSSPLAAGGSAAALASASTAAHGGRLGGYQLMLGRLQGSTLIEPEFGMGSAPCQYKYASALFSKQFFRPPLLLTRLRS